MENRKQSRERQHKGNGTRLQNKGPWVGQRRYELGIRKGDKFATWPVHRLLNPSQFDLVNLSGEQRKRLVRVQELLEVTRHTGFRVVRPKSERWARKRARARARAIEGNVNDSNRRSGVFWKWATEALDADRAMLPDSIDPIRPIRAGGARFQVLQPGVDFGRTGPKVAGIRPEP